MLGKLLSLLLGGSGIAAGVTNAVKVGAILTALPLAWSWFQGNQHVVVLTLDVSQALAIVGLVFALLQVAHVARSPGSSPWTQG